MELVAKQLRLPRSSSLLKLHLFAPLRHLFGLLLQESLAPWMQLQQLHSLMVDLKQLGIRQSVWH
tara:strand:- start:956 stop:1150 length:195 start_codon:yes stop_codon:yes gene_type:complete